MKNGKTIAMLVVAIILAAFLGGYIVAIFWWIMKVIIGLLVIGLVVGGFYLGKNWNKTDKK